MNIKTEIIKDYIASAICNSISDFDINTDEIADTKATIILEEIQKILCNDELDDFEVVDEIVRIFYRCNLSTGSRHDF